MVDEGLQVHFFLDADSARKKEESGLDLAWNDALGCLDCNKPPAKLNERLGCGIAAVEKGWF
jgi:hypothetical protein